MHTMEILEGLLRDLRWLRKSATLRRRTRIVLLGKPTGVSPLFCEVFIEWDDATLDGAAESIEC